MKNKSRIVPSRYRHIAHYDEPTIYAILDEALFVSIAYVQEGNPFIIPTSFVRQDHTLFIHGSVGSHFIRAIKEQTSVCLSVMLTDGLVVAKAAFDHNVNYRSVTVFSQATEVMDEREKLAVMEQLTNKLIPGSWCYTRPTTASELMKTSVLALPILEASAKVREGMPPVAEKDQALPIWSGIIPIQTRQLGPIADEFSQHLALPVHLQPLTSDGNP